MALLYPIYVSDHVDSVAGVVAADRAAVKAEENAQGALPSSFTSLVSAVACSHEQQLRQLAAASAASGQHLQASVHNMLATVLKIKCCTAAKGLLCNKIMQQSLLLAGMAGTGTRGHIDPAAAMTFAWGLVPDDTSVEQLELLLKSPLAHWLFISPGVFEAVPVLRKLLLLLEIQERRRQDLQRCQKAEHATAAKAAKKLPHGRQQTAQAEHDEAVRKRQVSEAGCLLDQVQLELEQGLQSPNLPADKLTEGERQLLVQLFKEWRLTDAQMAQVEALMGPEYVVVAKQFAGQGIDVKVGWMHFVYNVQPCFKVAFEVLRPEDAVGAVQMQRRLRCACTGLPLDYMCTIQHVVDELLERVPFLC